MEDDFVTVNRDDEQARRVAGLILAFSNAKHALSNEELRNTYYPQTSDEAFRKAFRRDRTAMSACGLSLVNVASEGQPGLWKVDEAASFPGGGSLSSKDALVLDVACAPLTHDPSFPHRSELRLALAKVDGSFGPSGSLERLFSGSGIDDGLLPPLLAALSGRRETVVTYQARGQEPRERRLRLYGSFGLRRQSYFVASELRDDGSWREPRVYRLDRFLSARVVSGSSYRIPPDFCVGDYLRLPFQIGPEVGTVTIQDLGCTEGEVAAELDRRGRHVDGRGGRCWEVGYSDPEACARWCVAHRLMPVGPREVTDHWDRVVEEACDA